jgi:1-aminocyclopropane-1-carboxylate deaminase
MSVDIPFTKPPIEPLECEFLRQAGVTVNVLRLDKIHPLVHGNKYYKLKYNLQLLQKNKTLPVLSFGGAYSNHLYALAAAGNLLGLKTIGVVRGELVEPLNPVLKFAREQGMRLIPVSRSDYRRKHEPAYLRQLEEQVGGKFQQIPEGGSNLLAVKGCEEIVADIEWQKPGGSRFIAISCGTGASMAGIVSGLSKLSREQEPVPEVLGISVLKAEGYIAREVNGWLRESGCGEPVPWRVEDSYHCGGYARVNPALRNHLEAFKNYSDIPIEPVYTGKLFYALFELIKQGAIPAGAEIIAIHSGGIVK